ncbi:hypothetical protein IV203_030848 [Nitzschia inconspicua]|uniref:Uncharacterized protein n=1 Tax=Nitzschia inconspicua TaxID=303405 RepID=A0A9K3L1T4_9STRA|nr:hypothetical protein IV203_003405 [Nitzschia inconspicua]KAG7368105.1 hypothetical protein IV203_030848 [Nitzschia inconspicua]
METVQGKPAKDYHPGNLAKYFLWVWKLMIPLYKEPNGKAGFSEDINKKIQSDKESSENNGTYESFFGVDWQVPVLDGVHFRVDHENDTPCQRGFLSRDREGTLRTWPWTAHPFIAAQTGLINSENDTLIQQLHSKCVSICMEADRNPSRQRALNGMTKNYLPYRKSRDLLVTEPSTPADHVLTDHSIQTIISAMWQGPDYTNFYNDIGEDEAKFFFSRHDSGTHSDMAVAEFGFPNDTKLPPSASHQKLTSNDPSRITTNTDKEGIQSKRPAVILPSPNKRARILTLPSSSLS